MADVTEVDLDVHIRVVSDKGVLRYPERLKDIVERSVLKELAGLTGHTTCKASVTNVMTIEGVPSETGEDK